MKKRIYLKIVIIVSVTLLLNGCSMKSDEGEKNLREAFTAQRNHAQSGHILDYKGDVYFSVLNEITYGNQKTAMHHGSIFKSDTNGNQPVKIADHYASYLTIHNDWLYFSSENLYRMPKDGGTIEQLISGKAIEFTINGNKIYYVDQTLEDGIFESDLDGASKKKIFEGGASSLTVFGDTLYLVRKADFRLYAISLQEKKSIGVIEDYVGQFCIDEQDVIYTGDDLYIKSLIGESKIIKIDEKVSTFNLQGEWIYYISANEGDVLNPSLYKARRDGSEKIALLDSEISFYDMEIYIADNWIYLFNPYKANQFVRLSLNGEDLQILRLEKYYKRGMM